MTYVNFPDPIKPLIPALGEILPQVGTIKSGIFPHFGFIALLVVDSRAPVYVLIDEV
jgi:hypothetical protein